GFVLFFFSSRRRHTRFSRDWSSDVCSSDLRSLPAVGPDQVERGARPVLPPRHRVRPELPESERRGHRCRRRIRHEPVRERRRVRRLARHPEVRVRTRAHERLRVQLQRQIPRRRVIHTEVHAQRTLIETREDVADAVAFLEVAERSEEHTSELQSRENLVCRLLLEKKKKPKHIWKMAWARNT